MKILVTEMEIVNCAVRTGYLLERASNILELRLYNKCCSGKALSITYSEFVLVTLSIHHAVRVRRFVICGLHGCIIFIFILSQKRRDFREKRNY